MRYLTFANVCSAFCLTLLLGYGGAHAAGLAKDSVTSKAIKNGQVKTKDLAKNAVRSAQVKDGSLTGADINESTLVGLDAGTVSGMRVVKVFLSTTNPTTQTVASFPGHLRLVADCSGGDVQLDLVSEENLAEASAVATKNGPEDNDANLDIAGTSDHDFDAGQLIALDDLVSTDATPQVNFDFMGPSGFVAHGELVLSLYHSRCNVTGLVLGG